MNMFGFKFGTKKRKQDCLLLTEDGRILEISPPAIKGCVVEHKTSEAWGLYPDSRIPKRGTNRLFQVLTERDAAPMSLDGNQQKYSQRLKEAISQIAQENASAARADLQKKSQKNKTAETLHMLLLILGITVGVVAIFGLFVSGKLHMPWSGGGGGGGIFG